MVMPLVIVICMTMTTTIVGRTLAQDYPMMIIPETLVITTCQHASHMSSQEDPSHARLLRRMKPASACLICAHLGHASTGMAGARARLTQGGCSSPRARTRPPRCCPLLPWPVSDPESR
eukprot:3940837-Rhodomonas_salina.8